MVRIFKIVSALVDHQWILIFHHAKETCCVDSIGFIGSVIEA